MMTKLVAALTIAALVAGYWLVRRAASPPDQSWFHSPEWQAAEREADEWLREDSA